MTHPKNFWKTTFILTFFANLAILGWSIARWLELGVILYRSVWGLVLLMYLALLAGCIFLFYWMNDSKAEKFISKLALSRLDSPIWRALGLGLSGHRFWQFLLWMLMTIAIEIYVPRAEPGKCP
jgi:hypothetical protein